MRKIYLVPNLVTTANLFCGFYSMVSALRAEYTAAAGWIFLAVVFDSLDGRIARFARATSQFGVEYDSLSDLVSFGVAPAILMYQWALNPLGRAGWIISFLFLACGALRLARFNVTTHVIPKDAFQGLPIPGGAWWVASFVIFQEAVGWPEFSGRLTAAIVVTVAAAILMISTVSFPSFKTVNWRSRTSFPYWMGGLLAILAIASMPEIALFPLITLYVVVVLMMNLFQKKSNTESAIVEGEKK